MKIKIKKSILVERVKKILKQNEQIDLYIKEVKTKFPGALQQAIQLIKQREEGKRIILSKKSILVFDGEEETDRWNFQIDENGKLISKGYNYGYYANEMQWDGKEWN